jgi:FixJ family two-component response regulator
MTAHPQIAAERPVILIVDDDPSVLGALKRLLRITGFEVRIFDRPSAILQAQIPSTNACFILDIHLPEMNGVELWKALRASGRELPAIYMTGKSDPGTRQLLDGMNAVALLIKPFDDNLLLAAIYQALVPGSNPTT